MNWPPKAFIYMKVGPHGGETLDGILIRKNREFEKAGMIFWSYGGDHGGPLHPNRQVQPFAQEWTKQGDVYVLMERLNSTRSNYGLPAGTATKYSANRDDGWEEIPIGIRTGLSRARSGISRALVLAEIERVDRELDLGDFEVGVGPSKGRNAAEYIKNQTDKGCLVVTRSTSDRPAKPISIGYQARLLDPYAVFLCGPRAD